jgi:hypothetical protein
MTVQEMLTKVSSYELSQWMAFEKINGPLGAQYSDDMLASIHEQLQAIQFILGRMSAGKESPVPPPHRLRRPHEVMRTPPEPDTSADEAAEAAQRTYQERVAQETQREIEERSLTVEAMKREFPVQLPGT